MSVVTTRFGPWRPLRPLGRGGMGVVYLAEHAGTGERCALKVPRRSSSFSFASVRHEADALGRIRHPGVVRLLDHGEEAGVPWLAIEHLPGPSLAHHLGLPGARAAGETTLDSRPAPRRRGRPRPAADRVAPPPGPTLPPVRRALELALAVADALTAVHRAGVLHGDLKLSNVLVAADGRPVLLDFGLRTLSGEAAGRATLHAPGAHGTVATMAPERLEGRELDPRSDLYSLGCMLYELVTGAPPFTGPDAGAVRAAHLAEAPAPPSSRRPEVPPAADALILRLLAKDPRDRPRLAEDVARALRRLLGAPEPPEAPIAEACIPPPALVGRGRELDRLDALLEAAAAGRCSVAALAGPSGLGRTRLLTEVARRARGRGFDVVVTSARPGADALRGGAQASSAPFEPLRPLLVAVADACHAGGPPVTRALLGDDLAALAPLHPDLALVPGAPDAPPPPPPFSSAGWRRVRLALRRLLVALASRRPLLLVLGDAHWADDATLGLLADLATDPPREARLLAVAGCRTDVPDRRAEGLLRQASPRLHLRPLDAADLAALARDMVGEAAARLVPTALPDGHPASPAYVTEWARAAAAAGAIRRDEEGRWWPDPAAAPPVAPDLPTLLAWRLALLDPADRDALRAVAAWGGEAPLAGLQRTLGVTGDALRTALEPLVRRHLLAWAPGEAVRFPHEGLWRAVYRGMDASTRAALHRNIARLLEEGGTPHHEDLGIQWRSAGDSRRAAAWLGRAARQALEAGAPVDAARLADEALLGLGGAGDPLTVGALHLLRGQAAWARGELPAAIAALRAALLAVGEPLPDGGAGWAARLAGELARHVRTPWPGPDRGLASTPEGRQLAARAAELLHRCYLTTWQPVPGFTACLLAVNRARGAAPVPEAAVAHATLGTHLGFLRLRWLAERYHARARELASLEREPAPALGARVPIAALGVAMARWPALGDDHERAIALAESVGAWEEGAWLEALRGVAALYRGDARRRTWLTHMATGAAARRNTLAAAVASALLAEDALRAGDPGRAAAWAEPAWETLATQAHAARFLAGAAHAACLHAAGDEDAAWALLVRLVGELPRDDIYFFHTPAAERLAELAYASSGGDDARALEARRCLRALRARLAGYAALVPIARPAALRVAALLALSRGRRARARGLLALSAAVARRLDMPEPAARAAETPRAAGAPSGRPA